MKKITRKNAFNREWRMKDRQAFYKKLKIACEQLVGKGYFELFSKHSLKLLYNLRYSHIRFCPENHHTITLNELKEFKSKMDLELSSYRVKTLYGEKISCLRFMKEHVLLIHYVQQKIAGKFKGAALLMKVFSAYFTEGEWYNNNMKKIIDRIGFAGLHFYSTLRGLLWIDLEHLAIVNEWKLNVIRFRRVKLQTCQYEIDGRKRRLFRMCTPRFDQPEPNWLSARPSQFGFEESNDDLKPIFIQQHAINRFEERASMCAGSAQLCIEYWLDNDTLKFHKLKDRSLVEFRMGNDHKVGYFVVSSHKDKLIFRTFLFLTNDGTPEGRCLLKLTHLARLDTQHLMIDKLSTFATYDIGNNPELRKLFTAAGCASLIDFIEEYNQFEDLHLQSADYIHHFLSRSFLFSKALQKQ